MRDIAIRVLWSWQVKGLLAVRCSGLKILNSWQYVLTSAARTEQGWVAAALILQRIAQTGGITEEQPLSDAGSTAQMQYMMMR